jgi:hypothetical protein
MFSRLLPVFSVLLSISLQAQNLTYLRAEQQGNEVVISYQLDSEKGKAYSIALYASHNNFASPLKMVTGDVNDKRILAGGTKQIRWQALDEVKNFEGDISFEIRVVPATPLFTDIEVSTAKVKRGKEVTISWRGTSAEAVKVELMKDGNAIHVGTGQNGKLTYTVSKKMKTGTYNTVLVSSDETVHGVSFVVKPKYPLIVKSLVVIGAGVGIWKLIELLSGGSDDPEKLKGPPDLTGD